MTVQSKENFVPKFEYITHVEKFFNCYLKQDKTIFQKYNDKLIYIHNTKEKTYDFFELLDICCYNEEKIIYDNLILNFCPTCDEVEFFKFSEHNSNICKYCFKKNLTEQDCIKIKPSCYKEEIKNLNKLLNETKLKNFELENQISALKQNHQLFKKNIENLNTILNF
ncbi:hypothetical protein C2G38_2215730 [Gigaspora rosea]|uniref:Uncharacterized protein n=1 Tax=Gigaspora rosea TaxID=44941 RepID=A0A397UDV1_9GLOM|nr:hypothetical protein C2G38_2215730 [Gigaspora rosea]